MILVGLGDKRMSALLRGLSLAVALPAAVLCGCSDYLDRRDSLYLGAGEAVRANQLAHVVDPWPAHARNTNVPSAGGRMVSAVKRYRCGTSSAAPGSTMTQSQTSTQGSSGSATSVTTPLTGEQDREC
jgi:hypothetical protein